MFSRKILLTSLLLMSAATHELAAGISLWDKHETKKAEECANTPRPVRVTARYFQGPGVGYRKSYTTLEAFFTPVGLLHSNWMPYADARGHIFNDGKPAANGGVGVRYLGSLVYGANVYYDYRKTHHTSFNQIGAGVEALGSFWGAHLNGYIPVGRHRSDSFQRRFGFFRHNNIYLNKRTEIDFYGVDAHAEFRLGKVRELTFNGGAGPYFFWGKFDRKAIGGRANVTFQWREWLSIGIAGSYDNRFHGRLQGQFGVNVPLGPRQQTRNGSPKHLCDYSEYLGRNLTYGPDRFEIIVTDKIKRSEIAINPATGLPYFVVFVNNLSSSLGTFESPFPTLALAQAASSPNDIIYVYPGNGTTVGMNTGILLQTNQRLWGAGTNQLLPTTVGTFAIGPQAVGMPLLANTTDPSVTCANNNEVSGIHLIANSNVGIDCTNIANAYLHDNLFDVQNLGAIPIRGGVTLNGCSGQITIQNNTMRLIGNDDGGGVVLQTTASGTNYLITNNIFRKDPIFGGGTALELGIGPNAVPPSIPLASCSITFTNNQATRMGEKAIGGFGFGGSHRILIANNVFSLCDSNPLNSCVLLRVQAGGSLIATVSNNTWQNPADPTNHSLRVVNVAASSSACVSLLNNTSFVTGTNGSYRFDNAAGGIFTQNNSGNTGLIVTDGTVTTGSCPQ